MSIITPITPTACSSIEDVLRTISEANIELVMINDITLEIIVQADLIDVGPIPDVICRSVTFKFSGATRTAALAAATTGPTTGDAVIQLGVDLIVAFFNGTVPPGDVVAIGLDLRSTVEQVIEQALRNGLGGAA